MTIVNNSTIEVELEFDLRHENENPEMQEGVQCLQVVPLNNSLELKTLYSDIIDNEVEEHEEEANEDIVEMVQRVKTFKRQQIKIGA